MTDLQQVLDAGVGRWTLDPDGSSVAFTNKTFWGLATVRGVFSDISGEGEIADDGSVSGRLQIGAASVNTKIKPRDKHLRSADFFHVDEHPHIVFEAQSATIDADSVTFDGQLTIVGQTAPLKVVGRVTDISDKAVTVNADVELDRRDYGVSGNQIGMMSNTTNLQVTARFTRSD